MRKTTPREAICPHCRKTFYRTHLKQIYCAICTPSHRKRKPILSKTCQRCGKTFETRLSHQVNCNSNCRLKLYKDTLPSLSKKFGISGQNVGALNELRVAADLLMKGFNVYRSVSSAASCDLLVFRNDGPILRVEVKTGYDRQNKIYRSPTSSKNIFDIVAIATADTIYYVPDLPL